MVLRLGRSLIVFASVISSSLRSAEREAVKIILTFPWLKWGNGSLGPLAPSSSFPKNHAIYPFFVRTGRLCLAAQHQREERDEDNSGDEAGKQNHGVLLDDRSRETRSGPVIPPLRRHQNWSLVACSAIPWHYSNVEQGSCHMDENRDRGFSDSFVGEGGELACGFGCAGY